MTVWFNKSPQATPMNREQARDGRLSFAFAAHAFWLGVSELWTFGGDGECKKMDCAWNIAGVFAER